MKMAFQALVVDDDPMIRYAVRGILERAKLQVEEAEDGVEALEKLDANAVGFDLVITDIQMPRMDGLELLKKVQLRPSPPKVIVITARGSERIATDAMKAGA